MREKDEIMAYVSKETKAELAPGIKKVLAKYGMKGTLAVNHHATLVCNLKSGPIDFGTDSVNTYHIDNHFTGVAKEFLLKLKDAMMVGNHDRSDIMTDYFDVGWYIRINVGKWDKPYEMAMKKFKEYTK